MKSSILLLLFGFGYLSRVYSASTRRIGNGRESSTSAHLTPIERLERYGYLMTGRHHSPSSLESAIIAFQQFAGLEQTGILDDATRDKLQARRCGVEDISRTDMMGNQQRLETDGTSRFKKYIKKDKKWTKNELTYYFKRYTPDLSQSQTRSAIQRAFQLWSDVSPLSFTESSSSSADIIIDFVAGWHGFFEFFDGPGGLIAHAFGPENGDVHFDEDETFTVGDNNKTIKNSIDLFFVAAHEFGHSLGLSHTKVPSALMYRFYRPPRNTKNYQLHRDDIYRIQQLYGKPDVKPTASTGCRAIKGNNNTLPCNSPWDAATYYAPDDVVYAFKDQCVWAINDQGVMDRYPRKTNKVFSRAPLSVQAAVSIGSRTYMFKGKKMWSFFEKVLEEGFPRANPMGLPDEPDAALQWGGDGKIYIFKGARFQEFSYHNLSVGPSRKISQNWSGIPTRIDATLQWRNGKTYFFKNNEYWRFNDGKMAAAKGYPKSRSEHWMGCGQPQGQGLPAKILLPSAQRPDEDLNGDI